ncbi:F5/8_type C domain-containing protein [Hexamita inflata]|uniref:F5/8 type C domain-containing protein n=1 Tax=Hexamita inflata TaxID=28002 RepID=A0AA86THN6_9EUKA|nr:F5/8 type C domain-containing protein [Hexamita inflata]
MLKDNKVYKLSKEISSVTRKVSDCHDNNETKYGACNSYLDGYYSWCPKDQDDLSKDISLSYLEFDFGKLVEVGQIITQGSSLYLSWVTKYRVDIYSGDQWYIIGDFQGNTDSGTNTITRDLFFVAQKLRIYPIDYHSYIELRAEVTISEEKSQQELEAIMIDQKSKLNKQYYHKAMINKYYVKTQRIIVYDVLQDIQTQITQNINCLYLTDQKNLIIYSSDLDTVLRNIIQAGPNLKYTSESYRFLSINNDDELESLGFCLLDELLISKCKNVNFTEHMDVKTLSVKYCFLKTLDGIQSWKQLTSLNVCENQLTNIEQLKELENLTILLLAVNNISDIEPLKQLKNLKQLFLQKNKIANLDPLENLVNLTDLRVFENQISNIYCLAKLKKLTVLNLRTNQISDIDVLKDLTNLSELRLQQNQISEIDSLSKLTNLTSLFLSENHITSVVELKDLTQLSQLEITQNSITDYSAIEKHPNFNKYKVEEQQ